MSNQQMTLAVIPARGGSKGVPGKNLRPLAGKPLIAWTILAAQEATCLDRTIVSTDDEGIGEVAQSLGAEVPFLRPSELAQDDTPDLPVLLHALDWLEGQEGLRPDVLVHLRPTQPLRSGIHVDEVVQVLRTSGADSVKSVKLVSEHPHKMWRLDGERLIPYVQTEFRHKVGPDFPRQQLEVLYVSSGLVDAVRTSVLRAGSTTGEDAVAFVTDERSSVDLDTPLDFLVAEALLSDGAPT